MKITNAFRWKENSLQPCEIRVKDGMIAEIKNQMGEVSGEEVFDARGTLVAPGFTDVHIHLREPGAEYKETIASGTGAALKGGFTTVCPMPNTSPVPDTKENLKNLMSRIKNDAVVEVLPYASISLGQKGESLTDMKALKEAGAFAFTDDGVGVQEASFMKKAMQNAAVLGMSIVAHCEDNGLAGSGVVHEGGVSERLELPGIPSSAESVHIARDAILAGETGCHYHVCHVSSASSIRVIREAKNAGINITAEVTPHHLLLNESDIHKDDAMYKMNPPLRSEEDRQALIQGLEEGTIDFIATDHAPHSEDEKQQSMRKAPFGITGLETAFPLLYTSFVRNGNWTTGQLIEWLTAKPRKVFSMSQRTLEPGQPATLTFVDLYTEEEIDRHRFLSKGKNTPFHGAKVSGIPKCTMIEGHIAWEGWNK
ncbi:MULTISPECIES: dihydroorotase [Salimicrobium]|uniref:Dihydroorotase n=2 Tax=Salimicrobium TaxID=351195 RepID=A0ABY1KUF5_9BACI|nr:MULTISPECIES: dihydroorotase [Salimicrobium]SDX33229.1 dihydroorotase [Salimicrobium album]SIS61956.1 dihydroorotase [Salimicrobium salexigens]